jgi:hypothetical protein
MLRRWSCSVAILVLAMAVSRPAAAQSPAPSPAVAPAAASYAPTLAATRLGVSVEDQAPLTVNASASRMGRREGRAFALVGGAAVIAGILIGDDAGTVIAIGGAAIGLYGLYIWQR